MKFRTFTPSNEKKKIMGVYYLHCIESDMTRAYYDSILEVNSPIFTPRRKKLKGYQKCRK